MPPGPIPIRELPDPHQILLEALEAARKAVCGYGPLARTCDCKYGLIPPGDPTEVVPLNALSCNHRGCEHTGCPEIRSLMARVKTQQRARWAKASTEHIRTSHGWLCCIHHPDYDPASPSMYDGAVGGAVCGGAWFCHSCTPEADRAHGLLPPVSERPAEVWPAGCICGGVVGAYCPVCNPGVAG